MKSLLLFLLLCGSVPLSGQSLFDSTYLVQSVEVYFATGKADVSTEANVLLDSVVGLLTQKTNIARIRISAHTDSIGESKDNEKLAQARAKAVFKALEKRKVPVAKMEISAFGERLPVMDNTTEEGRKRNRRATISLFRAVPMTTYAGQVRDRDTGKGIETTVSFRSKTRTDSTRTDTTGHYSVLLPRDSLVRVEVIAKGYLFQSEMTRVFGSPELFKKFNKSPDIVLPPAKPGEKAVIRDLFFVGDEATLLKISEPELPKIVRFMEVNPTIKVEVAGHINHPGVAPDKIDAWEQELSVKRAETVYYFLLKNGVSKDRVTYKGYGNSEMLFPKSSASMEQQQQNRRVEIKVVQ